MDYIKRLKHTGPSKKTIEITMRALQNSSSLKEKKDVLKNAAEEVSNNATEDHEIKKAASVVDQEKAAQNDNFKHTENILKTDLNYTENILKTTLKHTENLAQKNENILKTYWQTDLDCTDNVLTTYCKHTDEVPKSGHPTKHELCFANLSGVQRSVVIFFYQATKTSRQKHTGPVCISAICDALGLTSRSINNAIYELRKKRIIDVPKSKTGRGGWAQYQLNDSVFNELLKLEADGLLISSNIKTYWKHTDNILETNLKHTAKHTDKHTDGPPSSSSSNLIIETTTTMDKSIDPWETIQTPDSLKAIGFGKNHIEQIKQNFNFTPEQLQSSLEAFAFDLEHGGLEKQKKSGVLLLNYFFGAIKRGGYVAARPGFLSAEEQGDRDMVERLKIIRDERERLAKEKEELLFEEWMSSKSDSELIELKTPMLKCRDMFHKADLKEMFLTEMETFEAKIRRQLDQVLTSDKHQ